MVYTIHIKHYLNESLNIFFLPSAPCEANLHWCTLKKNMGTPVSSLSHEHSTPSIQLTVSISKSSRPVCPKP